VSSTELGEGSPLRPLAETLDGRPVRRLSMYAIVPQAHVEVIADHEAIGELLGTVQCGAVTYLHVRRFGPGEDELFIPSMAVRQVMPAHIYLNLTARDLL